MRYRARPLCRPANLIWRPPAASADYAMTHDERQRDDSLLVLQEPNSRAPRSNFEFNWTSLVSRRALDRPARIASLSLSRSFEIPTGFRAECHSAALQLAAPPRSGTRVAHAHAPRLHKRQKSQENELVPRLSRLTLITFHPCSSYLFIVLVVVRLCFGPKLDGKQASRLEK